MMQVDDIGMTVLDLAMLMRVTVRLISLRAVMLLMGVLMVFIVHVEMIMYNSLMHVQKFSPIISGPDNRGQQGRHSRCNAEHQKGSRDPRTAEYVLTKYPPESCPQITRRVVLSR